MNVNLNIKFKVPKEKFNKKFAKNKHVQLSKEDIDSIDIDFMRKNRHARRRNTHYFRKSG